MVSAVSSLLFGNRIWFRQKMYMRVLGCRILLFGRETVGIFRLFRESPMGSDMKM